MVGLGRPAGPLRFCGQLLDRAPLPSSVQVRAAGTTSRWSRRWPGTSPPATRRARRQARAQARLAMWGKARPSPPNPTRFRRGPSLGDDRNASVQPTTEQIEAYRRDGFVVVEEFLPAEEVERVADHFATC